MGNGGGQHGERACGMWAWHVRGGAAALSVEPLGPSSRSRLLTKRSLLRHRPPILMMSHAISSSSRIFRAWAVGATAGLGGESEGQGGGGGEGKGWPRRQCFRARRTCWRWTERASSLMRSRALMIEYGSHVLRVVLTVIEPSIRSSWVWGAG